MMGIYLPAKYLNGMPYVYSTFWVKLNLPIFAYVTEKEGGNGKAELQLKINKLGFVLLANTILNTIRPTF